MPYIKTAANVPIPQEKMERIKQRLGQDAALIGKSEDWLMVDFCPDSPLYFKGSAEPAAMVQVNLYGAAGAEAYGKFTAAVTAMLGEELAIPAARVFVSYSEFAHWGWNGENF